MPVKLRSRFVCLVALVVFTLEWSYRAVEGFVLAKTRLVVETFSTKVTWDRLLHFPSLTQLDVRCIFINKEKLKSYIGHRGSSCLRQRAICVHEVEEDDENFDGKGTTKLPLCL